MNKKQILLVIFLLTIIFSSPFTIEFTEKIFHENDKKTDEEYNQQEEIINSNYYEHSTEEDIDITAIRQKEFEEQLKMLDCSCAISKEDWFKQYKSLVEQYSDVLIIPNIYDKYSREELDLLFRVVQAEIGSEYSFEQKCNVVSVIYNRISDNRFGNTIKDILIKGQFSVISNGRINNVVVDENTILACEYVFEFGDTTGGALFFDSNGKLEYEFLFNDGAHNFYKTYN